MGHNIVLLINYIFQAGDGRHIELRKYLPKLSVVSHMERNLRFFFCQVTRAQIRKMDPAGAKRYNEIRKCLLKSHRPLTCRKKTYNFLFCQVTRAQIRNMNAAGFDRIPQCTIIRNAKLDEILLTRKSSKIAERRHTIGSTLNKTPTKSVPPVPQLVPLKSILKLPKQAPFNVRGRQSMVPRVTFAANPLRKSLSTPSVFSSAQPISPIAVAGAIANNSVAQSTTTAPSTSTPKSGMVKGTTAKMILNRLNELSQSVDADTSSELDCDFGKLRFSSSDSE